MTTKAIKVLPMLMWILLNPASSSNVTGPSPFAYPTAFTTLPTSTKAQEATQDLTTNTTVTEIYYEENNNTATSASSTAQPALALTPTTPTKPTPKSETSSTWLVLILFAIVLLMVFVGCCYSMRKHYLGETSSVGRLLLGVREGLRTGINNLEDRMGVRLWPGGKRGRKDDVEESQVEEEGQQSHDKGKGGLCPRAVCVETKQEHKEEDSETSDDYSSMEGDDLKERAMNRQKEEERNQSENNDEEDTSSASDGDQNAEEEKNGSEMVALVNSPPEDGENTNLCDVTAL
ncbi:uncharacterized protein LOC114437053 [Parambassis ranga]|uniref:Uncharacterized protein LOC114437053 n=1 Tax=Parambassis ranga TaxID=210632 RepID=A0A6P7I5B7_9TELE|nr:uncharacterized protein LOC114437053 [Parambassis ranga]